MANSADGFDPTPYGLPPATLEKTPTPNLVIYLDRVRENITRIISYLGQEPTRWRPHLKTTKTPLVWAELLKAGVRHFKCATTREADCLLQLLAAGDYPKSDLLLAYPLVGPGLNRLAALATSYPKTNISILCEDEGAIPTIPPDLGVFVDINLGMDRTGIPSAETDRILSTARAAGTRLRGLHGYEGHITGGEPASRRERAFACYAELDRLCNHLTANGMIIPELITSGTPGFRHALAYPAFAKESRIKHRVSPGTVVFHDARSANEVSELDLVPAALVLSRVISHPRANLITCDAGSKALAAEGDGPCVTVLGHPELTPCTPSEEHLPLQNTGSTPPVRGEVLYLLPRHICPTVNLADTAIVMDQGQPLGIHPIAARGHE